MKLRQNRVFSTVIIVLMMFFLQNCRTTSSELSQSAVRSSGEYTGQSDYRLVLATHTGGATFDPNVDILSPSAQDKFSEQVSIDLRQAVLKSITPLIGEMTGNKSAAGDNLFDNMSSSIVDASKSIRTEINKIMSSANKSYFPLVEDVMIIPWHDAPRDQFYSSEKISTSATEVTNLLKIRPGSASFDTKLTENINDLIAKTRSKKQRPIFLLATRSFLFLMPGNNQYTVRVLFGMQPQTIPMDKSDPRVQFKQLVIPNLKNNATVASFTFNVNLSDITKTPVMKVEFGKFSRYHKGNFEIDEISQAVSAPRLEGELNKTGGWVGLNFAFKGLSFDMYKMQIKDLKTLLSPGFRIASKNWVKGAFEIGSVNNGFKDEINNSIDEEAKKVAQSANEKLLYDAFTSDAITLAFNKLFGREVK